MSLPRVVPSEGARVQGNFIPGGVSSLVFSVFLAIGFRALFITDSICMVHYRGLQAQQMTYNECLP